MYTILYLVVSTDCQNVKDIISQIKILQAHCLPLRPPYFFLNWQMKTPSQPSTPL